MDGEMKGQFNGWINGLMDGLINEKIYLRKEESIEGKNYRYK